MIRLSIILLTVILFCSNSLVFSAEVGQKVEKELKPMVSEKQDSKMIKPEKDLFYKTKSPPSQMKDTLPVAEDKNTSIKSRDNSEPKKGGPDPDEIIGENKIK